MDKYITIPYSSSNRIFHLSLEDILNGRDTGIIYPNGNKPTSVLELATNTIFPNKICFSPSIEECCSGIYPRFSIYDNHRYEYLDLYVYEGIPDKDVKIINPKIVSLEVGEYFFSNEISIVTPIKIRKLDKIRVWTNDKFDIQDPNGYIKYEFIEGVSL